MVVIRSRKRKKEERERGQVQRQEPPDPSSMLVIETKAGGNRRGEKQEAWHCRAATNAVAVYEA